MALLHKINDSIERSAAVVVVSLLQIAATVILITLPLARDFDYEFNAALCVVSFLSSSVISIVLIRKMLEKSDEKAVAIAGRNAYIFLKCITINALNLLCSLAIVGVSLLFSHACSAARGLQFFFLLPVTGSMVGSAFGFLLASWFRKRIWIVFLVSIGASLALNLLWVIGHVPIYMYSIFWGYFAGPIYDEWIPITSTLLFHRVVALGFALWFYLSGSVRNKIRSNLASGKERVGVLLVSLLLLFIYTRKSAIGFDLSYAELRDRLEQKIITEHVQLICDKAISEDESRWISRLSEFYYQRISKFLNGESKRRVTVYVYEDGDQKKRLMGARETNFSKLWNDELHVNVEDCEDVLEHEMTHILANDFGHKYIGTARIGFLEGLAVASSWTEKYFTPHEWAASLRRINELPDVIALIGPSGFFGTYSRMSYIVCGSFTRYLIDAYGVDKFKQVYVDGDFVSVYEKQLPELAAEWRTVLDTISVSTEDMHLAHLLVQPSIFNKTCVHYVADITEKANEEYGEGRYDAAAALYSRALAIHEEDPRLSLARIRSQYYGGDRKEAQTEIDSLLATGNLNYLFSANAELLRGDLYLQRGDVDSAKNIYERIRTHYVNVSDVYILASLRIQFLSHLMVEALQRITATENISERYKLIEKSGSSPAACLWLARISSKLGNYKRVPALLTDVEFKDRILELDRLTLLAEASLREYRWEDAMNYCEKARACAVRKIDIEAIARRMELAGWMKKQNFN
jgi:tetratricopeptide (TPR) repeat protein